MFTQNSNMDSNKDSSFSFVTRKITNNSKINQNKITVIYEKENKNKNAIVSTTTFCLKDTQENFNQNIKPSFYKENENNKENIKPYNFFPQKKYHINVPSSTSTTEIYIQNENKENKKENLLFKEFIKKDLNYPTEYIKEIFTNIIQQSEKINYSFEKINLIQSKEIIKNRRILINWLSAFHLHCHYDEITFYLTIDLIDIYLSNKKISKDSFQLLGIICFWIASKYNEINAIPLHYLESLKIYKREEILNFEFDVLNILNYNISITTVYEIYRYLSIGFSFSQNDFYFGLFMLEVYKLDINSTKYNSLIIAQSICTLVYYINHKKFLNYDECGFKDQKDKIKSCVTEIFENCKKISSCPFSNVIKKFSTDDFKKICIIYNIVNV